MDRIVPISPLTISHSNPAHWQWFGRHGIAYYNYAPGAMGHQTNEINHLQMVPWPNYTSLKLCHWPTNITHLYLGQQESMHLWMARTQHEAVSIPKASPNAIISHWLHSNLWSISSQHFCHQWICQHNSTTHIALHHTHWLTPYVCKKTL